MFLFFIIFLLCHFFLVFGCIFLDCGCGRLVGHKLVIVLEIPPRTMSLPAPKMTNSSTNPSGSDHNLKVKMDPYVIHHSDNLSIFLVSPIPAGDNYGSWNHVVPLALRGKIKLGYLNGRLLLSTNKDVVPNWKPCTNIVGNRNLNSGFFEIQLSSLHANTIA